MKFLRSARIHERLAPTRWCAFRHSLRTSFTLHTTERIDERKSGFSGLTKPTTGGKGIQHGSWRFVFGMRAWLEAWGETNCGERRSRLKARWSLPFQKLCETSGFGKSRDIFKEFKCDLWRVRKQRRHWTIFPSNERIPPEKITGKNLK